MCQYPVFSRNTQSEFAMTTETTTSLSLKMLNKVPEITIYFWIIKILCTTIGETAADYLNETLGFGLSGTTVVMGILLAIVMIFQFRSRKYIPSFYWLAVVLLSVVGTLITDNLTDNLGVPLATTSIVFASVLAIVFILWYAVEKTLSVHTIVTTKREIFYWLAILFTFALGTAFGDLLAEKLDLGYLVSLFIFAGIIAAITLAHYMVKGMLHAEHRLQSSNAVLAFWLAYIFTRPLGASLGDYLSQPHTAGGLGMGTTATSFIFLAAILGLVIFLTASKIDVISKTVLMKDLREGKLID